MIMHVHSAIKWRTTCSTHMNALSKDFTESNQDNVVTQKWSAGIYTQSMVSGLVCVQLHREQFCLKEDCKSANFDTTWLRLV